jgi:hypothetical protein
MPWPLIRHEASMLIVYIIFYLIVAYSIFMGSLIVLLKFLFPKIDDKEERVQVERARRVHLLKRLSYRMAGRNGKLAY